MYKYSVVIPVLNGANELEITLVNMLNDVKRRDVEFVVSNNQSDDGIEEIIERIADDRLKYIKPDNRVLIGENLDYAYRNSTGEWVMHIGHDDYLLPSRFDVLDKLISLNENVELIHGRFARYHWPNFLVKNSQGILDPLIFDGKYKLIEGHIFGKKIMNVRTISGGGSWAVKRRVMESVRRKYGYFSSAYSVEFFAMRAAAFEAKYVIDINLPLWILGRANSSSGSRAFTKNSNLPAWDWEKETSGAEILCPYHYHGYATVSMDGALRVEKSVLMENPEAKVDRAMWSQIILRDLAGLQAAGKIRRQEVMDVLDRAIKDGIMPTSVKSEFKKVNIKKNIRRVMPGLLMKLLRRAGEKNFGHLELEELKASTGWKKTDTKREWKASSIAEVAREIDKNYIIPLSKTMKYF